MLRRCTLESFFLRLGPGEGYATEEVAVSTGQSHSGNVQGRG